MAFNDELYWALIENYQSGDWKTLASVIEQSDPSTINAASDELGIDLNKWYDDFLNRGGDVSPPPPPSGEKPPASPYTKGKKPKLKKAHSKKWYKKKEKQAKGAVAKKAWREAKKMGLGSKSAEKMVKGAIITDLKKQRESLKRHLRRLKKIGYKPQLEKSRSGKYKYAASRITAFKSEVKYLRKIITLSRFHTIPKSLAGRYPKGWKYWVPLTKKQYERAGLTKMPKEKSVLGASRKAFGRFKKNVLTTLAKEITKTTRKLGKKNKVKVKIKKSKK